jgi:hypothetical protein
MPLETTTPVQLPPSQSLGPSSHQITYLDLQGNNR